MGNGVMALFAAVFVDLFRLVADVFLLAGLVILRLLVMFLPAAAVIGVFAPLSGVVKQMANIGGAAVVNVVAFSAGSVVYTAAISAVLSTADDAGMDIMALVLCLVITLAAFVLMAPLLSFTRIFGHSSRRMRRHHLGRQLTRYVVTRQGVNDGTKRAIEDTQDQDPEPTVPTDPGERPTGKSVPRAEAFVRDQMVWDVTSDGGLSRTTTVTATRFDSRTLSPQRALPAPPGVGNDTRNTGLATDGFGIARSPESLAAHTNGVGALTTASAVSAAEPSGTVIRGQTLEDSSGPRPFAPVTAHDGNARIADEGIGYFVYDARTGAMLHRDVAVGDTDVDAS
ncbi:hypothetical protein ACK8HX_05070 [Oryzobacter sp. R7]|uniref:hypothetical protein n=1 Tax=Oryzobacter faecalis TaxID=3388656 RepID=UPI00398CD2DF